MTLAVSLFYFPYTFINQRFSKYYCCFKRNIKFLKNFRKYKYSSYQAILSTNKTELAREDVISLFDDIENFIETHQMKKIIINLKNETLFLE